METILNVVVPVFAIMGAGYLAGRMGLLAEGATAALNGFVANFALPALVFGAMAKLPLAQIFDWAFLGAYLAGTLIVFGTAIILATFVFPNSTSGLTLHAFCGTFSNSGYMGIPLFLAAFGKEGVLPAIMATLINVLVMPGLAMVIIEADRAAGSNTATIIGRALWKTATSPLVFSPIIALSMNAADVPIPIAVDTFCTLLGGAAGPTALFALGLFLVGKPIAGAAVEVSWMTLLKLVVHPLACWLVIRFVIPLPPFLEMACVVIAAMPTGGITFLLASRYGVFVLPASATILATTTLSFPTLSAIFLHYGVK